MAIRRNQDAQSALHQEKNNQAENNASSEHEEAQRNDNGIGGRGWHGDPEGHAAAGRKGGQKVAKDRDHMATIGRKGGEAVSRDRQHMADIGRKGGQSRGETTPAERSH
jgi:general stress protein YciG